MTNTQLTRFDTNALNRALLGFDTLFDNFEKRFANQVNTNYPPHNVVKFDNDTYEVQVAVTGFDPKDITVQVDQTELIIKGSTEASDDASTITYLHRGLSSRDFTKTFTLAAHMEVGEARIKNGVLKVTLKHIVPEALKPRILDIIAE